VKAFSPSCKERPLPVPNQVSESLINFISATTLLLKPSLKYVISPSFVDFRLNLYGLEC
jgi:hypothetical protein